MGRHFSRAVFLDRDGVLVEDVGLMTRPGQIRLLPGVAGALALLKGAGFKLLVVSNQAVVARGLADEAEVRALQAEVEARLVLEGAPALDGFYFCPHHPNATLERYRMDCSCRKPRPGLLLQAAGEHGIDLAGSFMIGDRATDLVAGADAGCRTILVRTGQHDAPAIETSEPIRAIAPDFTCEGLPGAAAWLLGPGAWTDLGPASGSWEPGNE